MQRPLHNSGAMKKRMKNTSGKYFHVDSEGMQPMDEWNQKAPIKANTESNSSLIVKFLMQRRGFCNFLTHSTGCAKVLISISIVFMLSSCQIKSIRKKAPAPVKDVAIDKKINPKVKSSSVIVTVPLMNPAVKSLFLKAKELFNVNNFEKAITTLERAYEIQPQAPEVTQLLAEISLHQGQYKQAHYWATIAAKNGPSKGNTCEKTWRILALSAEKLGYFANQEMALNRIESCLVKVPKRY